MRKELKHLVTSIPIFGPLILTLWRKMKKMFNTEKSKKVLGFDINNIKKDGAKYVSIDDDLIVDATPYIDGRSCTEPVLTKDDIFYLEFANVFRGSKDFIRTIHSKYVQYVHRAYEKTDNDKYFLDVGCGRGEFLELLDNAQIPAKGLEINEVEYQDLLKRGFNVHLEDCNAFFEKIENNSLIGVSALQVVEHFDPDYLQKFIRNCCKKICSNGVLILETVNPKCYQALTNFFIDITHIRPYPSETLKFLLEWYGFKDVRVIYFSPCSNEFRFIRIKEYNYMDYTIIAYKR